MTYAADDPRHQDFESQWWSDCANTFSEENKQLVYAHYMGLVQVSLGEKWPVFDLGRRNVLDVGGGPCSLLLKAVNAGTECTVLDPCSYPAWTYARYEHCNIKVVNERAEDWLPTVPRGTFDEVWIYNVLQHVVDPETIARAARAAAETIRIFDWVHTAPTIGHPHTLNPELLNEWFEGTGTVEQINSNGAVGYAYSGVFRK